MELNKRKQRQKYLIAQYSRSYLGFAIPDDVIILLQLFCQNGLIWTFCGEALQEFFQSKKGKKFKSRTFVQNKVAFECALCRNPTQGVSIGYVQFSLKMHKWEPAISAISVYYELKCLQTQSEWKNSVEFTSKWESAAWHNRILSNATLKQLEPKRLDFVCFVDIIHIIHKNNDNIENKKNENYIFIQNQCQYKWNIYEILLDHKRHVFFSQNFNNDCFCMTIKPKVSLGSKEDSKCIGVQLLKLPLSIKTIKVKVTIKVTKNTYNKSDVVTFKKSDVVTLHIYGNTTFYFDAFCAANIYISLHAIIAEIYILDVWDKEDIRIEHDQWSKYGISSTKNNGKRSVI